jgi:hypothetical protein
METQLGARDGDGKEDAGLLKSSTPKLGIDEQIVLKD